MVIFSANLLAGVGKSMVLASAVKKLEDEVDLDDTIVLYLSCDMMQSGELGESQQSLTTIGNTLMYQLYEYAAADEDDPTTLEDCNKVFTNPKQKKVSRVISSNKREETLPDLADALENLSLNLDMYVILVVDAVDRMTDEDQEEFYNNLQDLVKRGEGDNGDDSGNESDSDDDEDDSHFRILVGCRPGTTFYRRASKGATIDVGDLNGNDIDLKLTAELDKMTGWSTSEKEEAKAMILDKSASLFKYVVQVAIPFIQQPFQRPLSNRLKDLPEGMGETYKQAIQALPPNYLDLLRTALSWTLLAPGPVKVLEVMEAFTGEYLVPRDEAIQRIASEKEDDSYQKSASELEIAQLKAASGPFLNVWQEYGGQSFVNLKDPYQVKHFCLHDAENIKAEEASDDAICPRCKESMNTSRTLSVSEKQGHLDLAITLVRHLNSPLFQQRFNLCLTDQEKEAASKNGKSPEDEGYSSESHLEGNANSAGEAATVNGDTSEDREVSHEPNNHDGEQNGEMSTKDVDGSLSKANTDDDADESMDDEDRGDINLTSNTDEKGGDNAESTQDEDIRYLRYEMYYWYYHLREAEALWTPEERASNQDWAMLMTELDHFVDDNIEAFNEWQTFMFWQNDHKRGDIPWKPIHIAAYLGLTSWAEHLIAKGANLTEKCLNCNPLQAAALIAKSSSMLKLLLEHGVDLNDEEDDVIPAFHSWIWRDASYSSMELMVQHGADLKMADKMNGWTAMHYFANKGEDPKVLELFMDSQDPGNRANINAEDRDGETPLHTLLSRREVPENLLKAFVAKGANVNAEDKDSQRPLHEASIWGDANIIRIILPQITEIDDPDKRGRTALHEAAWPGYKECVQLLVENNADPNGTDFHNRTPLFFACLGSSQHTKDTIKFLLETLRRKGVPISEINKATKRLRTPLRQAAAHGFTETVKELLQMISSADNLDRAAMIDKADTRKGRNALHCAAYRGQTDCVRLLLDEGAEVNIKDHGGKTPLVLAYEQWTLSSQSSFEDIVDMFVEKDPAVAVRDNELLATAAVTGSKRILEKLHNLEADFNRPDRYGWTPIMLAKQFHRKDAVAFLKQQAAWAASLPSRWVDPPTGITLAADGLSLTAEGDEFLAISANKPLPAGLERYYFEVTSKKVDIEGVEIAEYPFMAVGFCTLGASAINYPGWPSPTRAPSARSWAYHGDDGGMGDSATRFNFDDERRYKPGDTVGCGVDFNKCTMWFTKNGERHDWEFREVRGRLFPVLGVGARLDLETNFGSKPFLWQDDGSSDSSDADDEGSSDEDEDEGGDGEDEADGKDDKSGKKKGDRDEEEEGDSEGQDDEDKDEDDNSDDSE